MKSTFFLALIAALSLTSCFGPKIFYSPDSYELAGAHKKVAIVPPTVSIAAKKKVDAEAIKEQQRTSSLDFQKEMYAWMLRRVSNGTFNINLMDIETTNAKLKQAGYPETALTPAEMAAVLGVDGIISSNYSMSKPMSEGGAIALALVAGVGTATNEIKASLSVHDFKNEKLIWNFEHKYSGGIGSSPTRLIEAMMRRASKKMPYKQKK